jgi:hypothetical protein
MDMTVVATWSAFTDSAVTPGKKTTTTTKQEQQQRE